MYHYHASFYEAVPHHVKWEDIRQQKAVIVTSFVNPSFYGRRLREILRFAHENFKDILLVTPGYLYRHTYNLLHPESCLAPQIMSLQYERKYIHDVLAQNEDIINLASYTVKRWCDFYQTAEFRERHVSICKLYQECPTFKKEIDTTSQEHLNHHLLLRKGLLSEDEAVKFIKQYHGSGIAFLLEELAMSLWFVDMGYRAILYPGKLFKAVEQLILGGYPDEPEHFTDMIQVNVRLQRRGSRVRVQSFA